MKLNVHRSKILEDTTAAGLQAQLDDFKAATGSYSGESQEREFVSQSDPIITGTVWLIVVDYTE